jgi:glycine/serine hydroxymethyltransferase
VFFVVQHVRVQTLTRPRGQNKCLYEPLATADPVVQNIIDKETWRQFTGLELIASEVRAPPAAPARAG